MLLQENMKLLYWMSLTTFAVRKGMVNKNDFESYKSEADMGRGVHG